MSELDGFVKEFVTESHENLAALDRALVELEKDPRAVDKLASIFRTVHSLKGTTAFFGFSKLGALAHSGENLLSRMRDGVVVLNPEITNGLLAMVDAGRELLSNIEQTGAEGEKDYTALIEKLTSFYQSNSPVGDENQGSCGWIEVPPSIGENGSTRPLGERRVEANLVRTREVATTPDEHLKARPMSVRKIVLAPETVTSEDGLDTSTLQDLPLSNTLVSNVRIDVEHLDKLMNLAGELVLARNQIQQFALGHQNAGLTSATQRLSLITTELQEGIMKTRMQPIENVWSKLPRVVRDLALLFTKRVRLEMEGSDTELDRTIIDAIRDPLTHLVRNCVDHGIEPAEKRVAAGKSAEGRLLLRAFHEGGQVNIQISDDGSGIDPDLLKRRAVELGLITSEHAQHLDERAAVNLIFLPGFSTAERVTEVSGRGVGMDVVKTNIEKIGGMVDVESKFGEGTTLKIRIPLTLAIIPALLVTSGGQRYAIPQTSVLELVRLSAERAARGVEMVHGSLVYRLRDRLLPLVHLNQELAAPRSEETKPPSEDAAANLIATNIVVLRADNRTFGVVVDEVNDTGEIVVKPLGKTLKGISIFAGVTIMGDGKVALILDVGGLARHARVLSQADRRRHLEAQPSSQQAAEDRQRLLLFTNAEESLMAIPLSQVTRLEEFPRSSLEWTGGCQVVQYQGEILPLVDLCKSLPGVQAAPLRTSPEEAGTGLQVVVYSRNDRRAGLKIGRIVDIVEERLSIRYPSSRKGSLGLAIIQGRVAEVLDMNEIMNFEGSRSAASVDMPVGLISG